MTAVRCTQETNLAWALIEAVKPQLKAVERNHVFVILGAGDTFIAIRLLLKLVAAKQILLRPHLAEQCSTWLDAYALHEEQENLRRLIEGLLIGDAIQGSTANGRPSATPRREALLTVTSKFRTRRLPAQRPTACRVLR
jgi:hypothetical protein